MSKMVRYCRMKTNNASKKWFKLKVLYGQGEGYKKCRPRRRAKTWGPVIELALDRPEWQASVWDANPTSCGSGI